MRFLLRAGGLARAFTTRGGAKKTAENAGGVDCLGLLVGIAEEIDLKNENGEKLYLRDQVDYGHYPDTHRLITALEAALTRVALHTLRPGDVALMEIDGQPQHLGIIGGEGEALTLIHAYAPARAVVEHALDAWWKAKIVVVYRLAPA